jgi:hypothetical protein
MAERGDAYFLKVIGCQIGQNFSIDVILAEYRLVALNTEYSRQSPTSITAPQPAG